MSTRRHRKQISKAQGYIHRLYTIEYDLHGMIQAYGPEFVKLMIDEITAGRIDVRQCVDRWAAHTSIHGAVQPSVWLDKHYNEFSLSQDECDSLLAETA